MTYRPNRPHPTVLQQLVGWLVIVVVPSSVLIALWWLA